VIEGTGLKVKNRTDFSPPLLPHLALNVGQLGLILSYALNVMVVFPWCIRLSVEVENMVMFILTFLTLYYFLPLKSVKGILM